MGCCLGEDANLAAAQLAWKLFFPTKGEAVTEGGAGGTPWWLGRSCHPMRLASQLAAQQCTQVPQNGSERPVSPICVHSCVAAWR